MVNKSHRTWQHLCRAVHAAPCCAATPCAWQQCSGVLIRHGTPQRPQPVAPCSCVLDERVVPWCGLLRGRDGPHRLLPAPCQPTACAELCSMQHIIRSRTGHRSAVCNCNCRKTGWLGWHSLVVKVEMHGGIPKARAFFNTSVQGGSWVICSSRPLLCLVLEAPQGFSTPASCQRCMHMSCITHLVQGPAAASAERRQCSHC